MYPNRQLPLPLRFLTEALSALEVRLNCRSFHVQYIHKKTQQTDRQTKRKVVNNWTCQPQRVSSGRKKERRKKNTLLQSNLTQVPQEDASAVEAKSRIFSPRFNCRWIFYVRGHMDQRSALSSLIVHRDWDWFNDEAQAGNLSESGALADWRQP